MSDAGAFECKCDAGFVERLWSGQYSLAVTTYQAGKVIFLSPRSDGGLVQLPRQFDKPMGLAVESERMAVATREEVVLLGGSRELARVFPERPGHYDCLFIPRAVFLTGELDLHDLAFSEEQLWAVNTRFSCLGTVDCQFNFRPVWRPPFVSVLSPEDRCHLNGFAMRDGKPEFATALGTTDVANGWRGGLLAGGTLMHVSSGDRVLEGLAMPHSPRYVGEDLLMLLSATGELVRVDPWRRQITAIAQLPGFARGLAVEGRTAFVGISKLRTTHRFGDLPIARQEPFCGVVAVDLDSGRVAGRFEYRTSCEEIYDVQVLRGMVRPGILSLEHPFLKESLQFPSEHFWTEQEVGA